MAEKLKSRLTPDDCAMCRHAIQKIKEAWQDFDLCSKFDDAVEEPKKECEKLLAILEGYLRAAGPGNSDD